MSRREPKGAEGSRREPNAGCWMPSKPGQPQNWVRKKQVQLVLPGTFILPIEGCKQENSPSDRGHCKKKGRQAGDTTPQPAGIRPQRHRETSGRHNPAASAAASGNWETGRRAGDTTPEPASQHSRDWETQGDKRETRPRSRRHSIWHLTAEIGRHRKRSGRHDPGAGVTASGT